MDIIQIIIKLIIELIRVYKNIVNVNSNLKKIKEK